MSRWSRTPPGISDHLKSSGLIEGWRLTRRKLGFGAAGLGEFHIIIETNDLAQLDQAFQHVSSRREPVEGLHHGPNSLVQNAVVRALPRLSRPAPPLRRREILKDRP